MTFVILRNSADKCVLRRIGSWAWWWAFSFRAFRTYLASFFLSGLRGSLEQPAGWSHSSLY